MTSTKILGRYAIRLCVLNHTTTADDVAFAIDRDRRGAGNRAALVTAASESARAWDDGGDDRPDATAFGVDDLRRVTGFESITEDQADRFLAAAREERHGAGKTVTERWAHARTFYIVLDGELP